MIDLKFYGEGQADVREWSWMDLAEGVTPVLTRKCLESRLVRTVRNLGNPAPARLPRFRDTIETKRKPKRPGATSLATKVRTAIRNADNANRYAGVVVVIDRDGPDKKDRLLEMKRGRDMAIAGGCALPCALGLAIETAEAWLLADGEALRNALGLERAPDIPKPERLYGPKGSGKHPKGLLASYLALDVQERTNAQRLAEIAEKADVTRIREKCTLGFAHFQDEVNEKIAPLFR